MASLHTVKGLEQRANLYHQVGASLGAGIPLAETYQFLAKESRGADGATLTASVQRLKSGSSLTEALRQSGELQPAFDLALLAAAEDSGHLDAACRRLGAHYTERAKITRKVYAQLMYPALLLHMAILIFPVKQLTALILEGSVVSYVFSKLLVLGPLYAGVWLAVRILRGEGKFEWRLALDRVLARQRPPVPGACESVRRARRAGSRRRIDGPCLGDGCGGKRLADTAGGRVELAARCRGRALTRRAHRG